MEEKTEIFNPEVYFDKNEICIRYFENKKGIIASNYTGSVAEYIIDIFIRETPEIKLLNSKEIKTEKDIKEVNNGLKKHFTFYPKEVIEKELSNGNRFKIKRKAL